MKIVYDERKRQINIEKHGIDFAELDLQFFRSSTIVPAKAARLMAVSEFRATVISVIFLPMGIQGISIVSARRSTRKERAVYAAS